LRASIAARSRFAEDSLEAAVARGVRQYVILGAGLDSFAYRNPFSAGGLRVFEVDHPATQAWKRDRLREAGVEVPGPLTFAPVDFEKETLADGLARAGFAADVPSFFSWLGVTVYLTRSAVMATLAYVASRTAPGSEIVFTFLEDSDASERASSIRDRARAHGEEWLSFFEPADLALSLRRLGFTVVEHFDAAGVNRRYFGDRRDGLRVAHGGHLMKARV
jgi:methyltransferase (TIGR00027 family)